MPAANKNDKQIMDVSKPGKSAPSASSKPIIVGHRTVVQDPMVTAAVDPEADSPEVGQETVPVAVVTSPSATKKVITPISDVPEAAAETEESAVANTENESVEQTSEDTSDSAVVDAVIDQVGDKKNDNKVTEEERKKQEHIEKLVVDKKYFIPIGKLTHRRNLTVVWVLLLIVIAAAGLLAATDAGMVDPGFDAPTNFIKE